MKITTDLPQFPAIDVKEHEDEFGIVHIKLSTRILGFVKRVDDKWNVFTCAMVQKANFPIENRDEVIEKFLEKFQKKVMFTSRFYKPTTLAPEPIVGAEEDLRDILIEEGLTTLDLQTKYG